MGYGLGGEVAWLKILAIGKIKAFTQRPAEVFGSSREGGLAQNRSVFRKYTKGRAYRKGHKKRPRLGPDILKKPTTLLYHLSEEW